MSDTGTNPEGPHWEVWFKLLWNAVLEASDDFDMHGSYPPEHPMFGLMETMHGIAEDQPNATDEHGNLTNWAE